MNKQEIKRTLKLARQVQDSLNKKKFIQGVSISGGVLQDFDSGTGIVKVTLPSGFGGGIDNVSIAGGGAASLNHNISVLDLSDYENKIEKISVDGVNCSISSDNTAIINIPDTYAKKSDISCVLKYKGTVHDFYSLPSQNSVGDVWNISVGGGFDSNNISIKSGDNVAWSENGWDVLAGSIDTSAFVTIQSGKGLSSNDFSSAEKDKLASIEAGAQVNSIENIIVNGVPASIDSSSKTANITVAGGSASLGTLLNAIDALPSIEGGNILYTPGDNTFAPLAVSSFAKQFFSCQNAAELRSLGWGFSDPGFDDCGNSWLAYGFPYLSTVGSKFASALNLNGFSSLVNKNPIALSNEWTADFWLFVPSNQLHSPARFLSISNSLSFFSFDIKDNKFRILARDLSGSISNQISKTLDGYADVSFDSPLHISIYFNTYFFIVFVNGEYADYLLLPSTFPLSSPSYFYLGKYTDEYGFVGAVSEFRLSSGNLFNMPGSPYSWGSTASPFVLYSFSPPSSPSTKSSDTIALLHFKG